MKLSGRLWNGVVAGLCAVPIWVTPRLQSRIHPLVYSRSNSFDEVKRWSQREISGWSLVRSGGSWCFILNARDLAGRMILSLQRGDHGVPFTDAIAEGDADSGSFERERTADPRCIGDRPPAIGFSHRFGPTSVSPRCSNRALSRRSSSAVRCGSSIPALRSA